MEKFEVGEAVIYNNGTSLELGIVKRICDNGDLFINYHTGDTAARTPIEYVHKIKNLYAFHIYRLDAEGNERKPNEIKL